MKPLPGANPRVLAAMLVVLLFALGAVAQVLTTSVTGRVTDPTGAAVSNATVTVRNLANGNTRSTRTDNQGNYTISQLSPGTYEITGEAASFSKAVLKSIQLNVGTSQTLNLGLKAGQATEVVEVAAENIGVETTRSDLAGVVTPVEVENLPLLNRTFSQLAIVMPEARPSGNFDPTKTRIGNVAFSGGDGRQVDVNIDGGDNKDNVVGGLLQNFPYESIQEFQVNQHRWTAESGRAVGAVVNVVTKSGTNDLHGSFFAQFRDEGLRRMDYIEEQAGSKPDFSRQEIGGSIGGPIVRDRAFFFGALERFRERSTNLIDPSARAQLALIPGITPGDDIPTPYDDWLAVAKFDQRITNDQNFFVRYAFQDNSSPNDQIGVPARADATHGNTNNNRAHSLVFNHTATLGNSSLNQFAFHWQDFKNEILGVTDTPLISFPGGINTGRNPNVPQSTIEKKWQLRDDFSFTTGRHNLKLGTNYVFTKLDGFFYFGAQGYAINFFDSPQTIATNTTLYPQGFATPGAVQQITYSDGKASHAQDFHQIGLYVQDDWKLTSRLTLNLGLRWDAHPGLLPDQTNNRTILLLKQLNHPLAQEITEDAEKLSRRTPSLLDFQPRVGFAYDPTGSGRTVIRGGYGIFFDQIFQNLTLFSQTQSEPELFQTIILGTNNAVGSGQLASYRFGVDPLPALPAGTTFTELNRGGFGRINDPDMRDPYVQKFSIGFETTLMPNTTLSSDFVHTLGLHEGRVQVINPRIRPVCDPAFPGSTPTDPQCVRGANTRVLDAAFVAAGMPSNRLEQINMIGTTNRSLYDSWTTSLRRRTGPMTFNVSYVLSSSRAWGGQPTASYGGNGLAVAPQNQFIEGEFGPTRIDERHRFVLSGVFNLPWDIQLSPIWQWASARPYSRTASLDIDGDGLTTLDRLCVDGSRTLGCQQQEVNNNYGGIFEGEEHSGRYFNVDLRASKGFRFTERVMLKGYVDFFNLFNNTNLSFANRLGLVPYTANGAPQSLFGPGFGPPVGRPFTVQLGARIDF